MLRSYQQESQDKESLGFLPPVSALELSRKEKIEREAEEEHSPWVCLCVCVCEIRHHMRNNYFGSRFYNAAGGLVVNASTSPTKRLAYDTDISGDAH